MAEKRGADFLDDSAQFAKRPSKWDVSGPQTIALAVSQQAAEAKERSTPLAFKILLSAAEAQSLSVDGGRAAFEVEQATSTEVTVSGDDRLYPGCTLQEVCIRGSDEDSVLQAIFKCCTKILQSSGKLASCEEAPLRPGDARIKVALPLKVSKAVLGFGGSMIRSMREQTGLHIHIEHNSIPPGPQTELTEQVICLDGPIVGIQMALQMLLQHVDRLSGEQWFATWSTSSYCGTVFPGLTLFADSKGRSKGAAMNFGSSQHPMPVPASVPAVGSTALAAPENGIPTALKLLISSEEASIVVGKGGLTIKEISQGTNARMNLSGRFEFYPGTKLQELRVVGWSEDAVVHASMQALRFVTRTTGIDTSKVHLLIATPLAAAQMLANADGRARAQQLRDQQAVSVDVSEIVWPPGPHTHLTEQLVTVSGPMDNIGAGLSLLISFMNPLSSETWFNDWAGHSHCVRESFAAGKGSAGAPKGGFGHCKGQGLVGARDGKGLPVGSAVASYPFGGGVANGTSHQHGAVGAPYVTNTSGMGMMAIKVLIDAGEADCLRGDLHEFEAKSGTTMILSEAHYPGIALAELRIQGAAVEHVQDGLATVLHRITNAHGLIASGDMSTEMGSARMKLVVPSKSAASLIGPGGSNAKQLKFQYQCEASVDRTPISCSGQVSEQAVLVSGLISSIHAALPELLSHVGRFAADFWFAQYASHSNAGRSIPGLVLFPGKGNKGGGCKG